MSNVGPLSKKEMINRIRTFPANLLDVVGDLSKEQLDTPMKEDGWTIRQMVHHIADSHVHIFTRMRFVLTEEKPTIKAYKQDQWALLPDAVEGDVNDSILLLQAIHNRSATLLVGVKKKDFEKRAFHPEVGEVNLEYFIRALIFHGQHHLRKIKEALLRAEEQEAANKQAGK